VGRQAVPSTKVPLALPTSTTIPFRQGWNSRATRDPLVTQHQVVAQRASGCHSNLSQHDASFNHAVATDDQARSRESPMKDVLLCAEGC
jgi:hypothetical protein